MADCLASFDGLSEQLSQFIGLFSTPTALCNTFGTVRAHNASFATCLGHDGASLVGRSVMDYWEPARCTNLDTYLAKTRSDGLLQTGLSCSQLSLQPVMVAGHDMLLAQSAFVGQEDTLHRFLSSHSDQGFWEFDATTGDFAMNEIWQRMHGYDSDRGQRSHKEAWLVDVHPDDLATVSASFNSLMSGAINTLNVQYRRRHKQSQDWIWLMCRATIVGRDPEGAVLRIVGTDTDISDIKGGEIELEQLNRKIQLAIEVSGIGIWEFDSATSSVHWDDRLLEIYGLEPGTNAQSGDFWASRLHPEDRDALVAHAAECARTKSDLVCDFRIVRPDGEVRHVRTMARYADLSGTQTKLFGVNIDVTADVRHAQELEKARKQLEHDSRHDALTGLANRRLIDETLQILQETHGPDHKIAVMHLDLDHFKAINDTLGHAAGDAVLVHVANTLRNTIKDASLICRIGGDEFVVLFEHVPPPYAVENFAQRVIGALSLPIEYNGHICRFGVSIGAAVGKTYGPVESNIFTKADVALYAAKDAGRSCFRMYDDRTTSQVSKGLNRHQDVVDMLSEDQIECWYQPQFDAKTGALIGAEALARVRHPTLGILVPDQFLPLASDYGFLPQFEAQILACVLRDQTNWATVGITYPTIAVNISKEALSGSDIFTQIVRDLEGHHLVSFELLETAFLDNPDEQTKQNLCKLRDLGIAIELDDFGSGHASIVALSTIRPDGIKVDQRLVAEVPWNAEAAAVLRALVSIARAKNLRVVLEGVETPEHVAAVADIDCDVLQGFALCEPQSAACFAGMLGTIPQMWATM